MTQPRRTGSNPAAIESRTTSFTGNTAGAPAGEQAPTVAGDSTQAARGDAESKRGLFESHAWAIPAFTIVAVVVAFVLMIVITALAGGNTFFTD